MLDSKLETFLTVVELHSYTLAAEALHITQPAVTQHIRKLEEHYGCKLIDFTGHQLALTQAGKLLYRYGTLQMANELVLHKQLEGAARTLRVGATLSIADYYLPRLLGPYLKENNWGISLRVGNTEEMLEDCSRGKLDCAFIEGIFYGEDFRCHVFHTAQFLPVAAADHPLAGSPRRLAELYDYPLVLREQGSGTRAILENHLFQTSRSVQEFSSVMECGSFRLIKEILKQTQAVSFMYEQVAAEEAAAGTLTYLELSDCAIQRPLHFVYPRNSMARQACEAFYERCIAP